MMYPSPVAVADTQPSQGRAPVLYAEPGDILIIDRGGSVGLPRTGIILAVPSSDGAPPYLVHWIVGDYDSRVTPGPGARIEARRPPGAASALLPPEIPGAGYPRDRSPQVHGLRALLEARAEPGGPFDIRVLLTGLRESAIVTPTLEHLSIRKSEF